MSKNEEFVNRILDNSIKVNEFKFSGRNNTFKTIPTQRSSEENDLMECKIPKENYFTDPENNGINIIKDANIKLHKEIGEVEIDDVKFNLELLNLNPEIDLIGDGILATKIISKK